MTAFLAGFGLSFSLIVAIGAQNAFVLKQGLMRQHVFLVCFICALSDALLISAGVWGFAAIIQSWPWFAVAAKYGGAAFLLVYGAKSFYSAYTSSHHLNAEGQDSQSAWQAVTMCLAFTWLNPHVYLDTIVLLGAVASPWAELKHWFAAGAVSASFIFFFGLGYAARLAAPLFAKPQAWKILEATVGVVMWLIAASLLLTA